MSDETEFLKSIADQPKECSTRLVYADWLDEHDRPREAEFLRLQLQVAELNAQVLQLGGQLEPNWLTAIGNPRTQPEWITLRLGRDVVLREWRQWNVYAGLMAGVPTSQDNRESIERIVTEQRQLSREEPYLIQPRERPVKDKAITWEDEPRGLLPTIVCVGGFTSYQPAKDKNRHASHLTVIWFQHEWAFPIDPGVREQIRAIDWEKHAHDFDW
jgi:uncharacterized protein (TIGR02996 family)